MTAAAKILTGLSEAVAFVRGEIERARVHILHTTPTPQGETRRVERVQWMRRG